jgi:hypothetical protein
MYETLCWSCLNAVPDPAHGIGCEWSESKATVPVPGWEAEYRPMHNGGGGKHDVPSYRVIKCPEYINDSPRYEKDIPNVYHDPLKCIQNIYSAWDKETGELIASGTAEELAVTLGYICGNVIRAMVNHRGKYKITKERIKR